MKFLTPARVTLLMFVVVGGLIAAYVAKGLFARETKPVVEETRLVPMAVSDIEPGTLITDKHIGRGRMKASELKDYPGMLIDSKGIVDRVVKTKIKAGTPILAAQLYQPGESPPLEVSDKMRAVSLNINDKAALVDGRIKPGQYVDVHFTPNGGGYNTWQGGDDRFQGGLTLTLFKGVKVLAINSRSQPSPIENTTNTVMLELTPTQANIMILARERGNITLTFNPEGKGDGGVAVSSADRATLDEILNLKPPAKPKPPFSTENYRGTGRSTLDFRDGRIINNGGSDTLQQLFRHTQRQPAPGSANDRPMAGQPGRPGNGTDDRQQDRSDRFTNDRNGPSPYNRGPNPNQSAPNNQGPYRNDPRHPAADARYRDAPYRQPAADGPPSRNGMSI